MLNTNKFGNSLKNLGYDFFSGVPCSFLKYLINYAINDCEYIMATNEGDAVATCAGASVAGRKTVVLMQNSGLTNATSPLTSLTYTFKIPVLGFVSLRGEKGINDEPQHDLMGRITTQMLDLMKIPWGFLSNDFEEAIKQLSEANKYIEKNETFFFVVKKGTFDKVELKEQKLHRTFNKLKLTRGKRETFPPRILVLKEISKIKNSDTVLLATTGKTGRELYEVGDSPNNLYMVGSLGCISPFAMGIALSKPDKNVIAIDGDGSLLMRMGTIVTNAYYQPKNMLHILLDNNSHDSTGGQATISQNVDFIEIASSVGYETTAYIHDLSELEKFIKNWKIYKGLCFLYIRIAKGSKTPLGRPKIKPYQVKERLVEFLNS